MSAPPRDISTIWASDPRGALDVLPTLLAAPSVSALWDASASYSDMWVKRMEAQMEDQLDALGPMGNALRRDMRPGLFERALDLWDDLKERLFSASKGADVIPQECDLPLSFGLPLLETYPTAQLNFDYSEIYGETARQRAALGRLISAERNRPAQGVTLPGTALTFIQSGDDWNDDEMRLSEIDTITAYWPPAGDRPALALSERQEDGGLPVSITLMGHTAAGHAEFVDLITRFGGELS